MKRKRQGPLGFGVFRLYSEKERDNYVAALTAQWEEANRQRRKLKEGLPFVTISREFGCMALETGLRLAEALNQRERYGQKWTVYDKDIVRRIAHDLHLSTLLVEQLTSFSRRKITDYVNAFFGGASTDQVYPEMVRVIRSLCETGHSVVIGRGGCKIAADLPRGLHIRIVAPFPLRVEQVAAEYNLPREDAERRTRLMDAERNALFKKWFRQDISDPTLYDMVLDQSEMPMDQLVDRVVTGVEQKTSVDQNARASKPRA